jgi:predicted Zn-dependent protease
MIEQALFDRAVKLKDQGDFAGAQQIVEQLIAAEPTSAGLHWFLGMLSWEQGASDKAERAFRRATELNPHSENASLGLFHCLWETGRQAEALGEIKRFLTIAESQDYRQILAEINAASD